MTVTDGGLEIVLNTLAFIRLRAHTYSVCLSEASGQQETAADARFELTDSVVFRASRGLIKWELRALRAGAAFCRWGRRLRSVQLFVAIDHHLRRFLSVQISVCHTDALARCPPDAFPRP